MPQIMQFSILQPHFTAQKSPCVVSPGADMKKIFIESKI